MTPNNIYVQGSYIDIHDNENVYLTVDKGEVHLQNTGKTSNPTDTPTAEIPSELQTEEADTLLHRFTEAGLLTNDWQPVGLSLGEKGILASFLAERLGIKHLWQLFAPLWGVKPSTLRRAWNKALDQNKTADFLKKLKLITT